MSEHDEQVAVMQWSEWMAPQHPDLDLLYAVPNGGHRNKATAGKLRAEGVKAGVPDLCLPVSRGDCIGLYIEMKRPKAPPSAVSDEQRRWHERLHAAGHRVRVCRGADEAIDELRRYLEAS